MKKGIVLEVHDEDVTILTPEGEFLKSRKQKGHIDIGEEVTFFPLHQTEKLRSKRVGSILKSRWAIIAAAAVFILALSFYPQYVSNQVYAYISVDVNPSIELGVNKEMEVISMEAYNEEGREIIERLADWKKEDITKVTTDLFSIIRQQGYFKENNEVLIASILNNETNSSWKTKMQGKITALSDAIKTESISITTMESTLNKRTDAIKEGLSPGKFIQKEKEKEVVESEDTSKTEVVPTTPVNAKPLTVSPIPPNKEQSKPTDIISNVPANKKKEVVKVLKAEQKDMKKELKEVRKDKIVQQKEKRKEKQKDHKVVQEEKKEERKADRKERRQEQKGDRFQQKIERKSDLKEKRKEIKQHVKKENERWQPIKGRNSN